MEQYVVAIRDIKAETFAQPWFVISEAVAVRAFTDLVNNPERGGTIHTHSEDYQLYVLGKFDDTKGQFTTPEHPKHLVTGSSVKKEQALDRNRITAV